MSSLTNDQKEDHRPEVLDIQDYEIWPKITKKLEIQNHDDKYIQNQSGYVYCVNVSNDRENGVFELPVYAYNKPNVIIEEKIIESEKEIINTEPKKEEQVWTINKNYCKIYTQEKPEIQLVTEKKDDKSLKYISNYCFTYVDKTAKHVAIQTDSVNESIKQSDHDSDDYDINDDYNAKSKFYLKF